MDGVIRVGNNCRDYQYRNLVLKGGDAPSAPAKVTAIAMASNVWTTFVGDMREQSLCSP
jgi:hypothetical protein